MTNRPSERHVIAYLAFMGILLAFGIDISLPALDEIRPAFALDPDSNRVTLIITLYLLGMAGGQIIYGPFADRFGRAPVLRTGIVIYALGAVGSALAPNIELLFASRLLWGFGAAAPGVLRLAVARDLYLGNQMARVMSITMAFFLIGPIIVPLIGEGILSFASWRWVFAAALLLAAVLFVWSFRFGETLDPANRRPLELRSTISTLRIVLRTRSTMAYLIGMTFGAGAFFIFLGSSQPIFDRIYGRADQFALIFGASGIFMAGMFFGVNIFIERYGSHRVAIAVVVVFIFLSAILAGLVVAADGVPNFWVWISFIAAANAFLTLITPTCYSLGLEPMGELAGTASGVMGLVQMAGGAILAAVVDALIDDTVTPMVFAYVIYGVLCLGFLMLGGKARQIETAAPN